MNVFHHSWQNYRFIFINCVILWDETWLETESDRETDKEAKRERRKRHRKRDRQTDREHHFADLLGWLALPIWTPPVSCSN